MARECRHGVSLRTAHQAAFEKVVIADTNQQSAEDRARLRTLAQIVFQALQKHEERCLVWGAEWDA
jgi:uncharacterized DUF497 family protein